MRLTLIAVVALLSLSCASTTADDAHRAGASVEQTHECDTQAAHPEDIQRFAPGKADEEVVGVLALRACSQAVEQFPDEARFHFQKARSLAALKREEEAAKAFEDAASMGYGPAKFYRAQALLDSYFDSGPDAEYEQAVRLLEEIKDSFAPAEKRHKEVVFSLDGFQNPRIIESLYRGDVEHLNRARILVAFYAMGMQEFLATEFHPETTECPALLVDTSINLDLEAACVGDPRNTLERLGYDILFKGAEWAGKLFLDEVYKGDPAKWRDYYKSLGRRDAHYLALNFGCQSPVSRRLYQGLVQFARAKRPLSEYAEELNKGRGKDLFLVPAETPVEEPPGQTETTEEETTEPR